LLPVLVVADVSEDVEELSLAAVSLFSVLAGCGFFPA